MIIMEEKKSIEEQKLRYKLKKASSLFCMKGHRIECNGNLLTLEEYLTPTIDLLILKLNKD